MEDFVNFDLAKKLKGKGFTWDTIEVYERNTLACIYEDYPKPTISQVLKWLREEKNIHICIDIYDDGWFFDVASFYKADTDVYEIDLPYKSSNATPDYDTYEQAALAGIEYVLDNFI